MVVSNYVQSELKGITQNNTNDNNHTAPTCSLQYYYADATKLTSLHTNQTSSVNTQGCRQEMLCTTTPTVYCILRDTDCSINVSSQNQYSIRKEKPIAVSKNHFTSTHTRRLTRYTNLLVTLSISLILAISVLIPSAHANLLSDSSAQTYSDVRSPKTCSVLPVNTERENVFINDSARAVTFVTSRRPIHQLITEITATLLRQLLGYNDIEIHTVDYKYAAVGRNSYHTEYYHLLLPSPTLEDLHIRKSSDPKYMIDMQVWMNPAIPIVSDVYNTKDYLGAGGRFAWFFPSFLAESSFLLEHWGIYSLDQSRAIDKFYRSPEEISRMYNLLHTIDGTPHCTKDYCNGSVYTPPWCEDRRCALLFAADQNTGRYLQQQIFHGKLYVQVAFFGPNFNRTLVEKNIRLKDGRSMLFFHWSPSVLLNGLNLTTVDFPPCQLMMADHSNLFCYYELHRMNKFIWSNLESHAPTLYNAIYAIQFYDNEFMSVLKHFDQFKHGNSISDIACSWISQNEDIWRQWHFKKKRKELKLAFFFSGKVKNTFTSLTENGTVIHHRLPKKFNDPGNHPAFAMAVEAVNANQSVLSNYQLGTIEMDTECTVEMTLVSFIAIIAHTRPSNNWKNVVGIVGPACSDSVEPIAGVAKEYDLPLISYGAEGAIFSDEDSYPNFFRTIPENKIFRYVFHKLFSELNWKRIASLTEDEQGYSEYLTPLHELLEQHGYTFMKRKYRHDHSSINMTSHLNHLRDQRATVIIGDFYEDAAASILCQAYHMGITACNGFVWFLPKWYSHNWYKNLPTNQGFNCTEEQMLKALEGHMSLAYQYFSNGSQIMQENITTDEWYEKYLARVEILKRQTEDIAPSNYAGFTYDAVWSFALALDQLAKSNELYMADFRSPKTMSAYLKALESLHFHGVSGEVTFRHSHSRTTDIIVWQFQRGEYQQVAKFYTNPLNATNSRMEINKSRMVWPCDPPVDKLEYCWVEPLRSLFDTDCYYATVMAIVVIFLMAVTVFIVTIICIRRTYQRKVAEIEKQWHASNIFNKFTGWEILRNDLVLNRRLGEGQYGIIYGGECNIEGHGWVPVAAKTLKKNATITEKLEFLSEADLMKTLQHENVVRMLGVIVEGDPMYVIMEFMLHGDLKTYLLARRNLVYNQSRNDEDEISDSRLTSMVRDVAKGLQFLSDNKYVHRDLACRNCLVNVNKTVKIGDFGMTRLIYETNYYRFSRRAYLPVRWMAPESLIEGVYTSMSDIWSFGVVLFEVITFGSFPFQGMNNSQVLDHVKEKKTLTPPPFISPLLDALLQQCWNWNPSRRPTASQIVATFTNNPVMITPSLESPESSVVHDALTTAPLEPSVPKSAGAGLALSTISTKVPPSTTSLSRRLSLHPVQRQISAPVNSNPSLTSVLHYSRASSMSSGGTSNQNPPGGRHHSGGSISNGGTNPVASTVSNVMGMLFNSNANKASGRKRSMSGNMAVPPITCSLSETLISNSSSINSSVHNHTTLDALNLSIDATVLEERSEDGDNAESNTLGASVNNNLYSNGAADASSSGYASTSTGGSNASSGKHEKKPLCRDTLRRNKDTMFFIPTSSVDECSLEVNSSFEDEGAVPLLPQVRFIEKGKIFPNSRSNPRNRRTDVALNKDIEMVEQKAPVEKEHRNGILMRKQGSGSSTDSSNSKANTS